MKIGVRLVSLMVAAGWLGSGSSSDARPAPPAQGADGKPVVIALADRTVSFASFFGRDRRNGRCTLQITEKGMPMQVLETIGAGNYEAETCLGLLAIGRIAPRGRQLRVAALYRASSPNAVAVEPIIIVRSDRSAPWRIDDALSQRVGEANGTRTIDGIRRFLKRTDS